MRKIVKKTVSVMVAAAMTLGLAGCATDPANGTMAGNDTTGGTNAANNVGNAGTSGGESAANENTSTDGSKKSREYGCDGAYILVCQFGHCRNIYRGGNRAFQQHSGSRKGNPCDSGISGAYTDLHQKLQAAYIAKTAPELTVLEIGAVGLFAQGGMIQPIDDRISSDGIDMGDFHDGLLYNCYIDGSCYTLPFLRSTSIFYMNTTILEQAGVNPDDIVTWDDVAKASETIKEKTGKYGISMPINYWFHEAFMLTEGGFTVNDDETVCTVDNDVDRKIIAYFKDLKDRGLAHLYPYAEYDKMSADLMNQDAAFFFQSTGGLSQMLAVADQLGFKLQTAFIPKGTQYGVTTGGCNIAMLSGLSKEKQDAAWEYMKFMTSLDETVEASIVTGYLATRKSAMDAAKMVAWYEKYPQYKVALDQLEVASGRPNNPGYVEFQVELTNAMAEMMVNDADVDSTLKELEAKGNELLNE